MYKLIRPVLFLLDAETSHRLTLGALAMLARVPGLSFLLEWLTGRRVPALPVEIMGLKMRNPLGLAAGLDKNAACIDTLGAMGFGWVETGTVTPKPQPGNPRKRLFRLVEQRAIINRMGFNSAGLVVYRRNLARVRGPIPVGANIGKNRLTPIEAALDDYLVGMRAVYARADYIAINISSPNTQNLRELQETDNLDAFLQALKAEQASLTTTHARYVPLALKIAPDLSEEQIGEIARLLLKYQFDAVIATNTTTSRPQLDDVPLASETGGLSGEPLRALSTRVISRLYASLQGQVTIIGVGGISSAQDAWEKLLAGADALQLYSAFIYQGPAVIRDIVSGLALKTRELGCDSLQEAVRKARASNPVP